MRRLSSIVLALGVVIGVAGAVGLALGFRPSQLPAGLLDLSVYKLTFIAAGAVLAAGAVVRRAALRDERSREALNSADSARAGLSAGESSAPLTKSRAERQPVERDAGP